MMKNRENYPRISAVELKFIEFCHHISHNAMVFQRVHIQGL